MTLRPTVCVIALSLTLLGGCSKSDQERARERAAEAKEKTRDELHKLDHQLDQSLKGTGTGEASHKLDTAAHEAGRELDHAATLARVKTKLASDAGLSTVTNVTVHVDGGVVTLDGSVASADQKRAVEQSAASVQGVTKVVDNLRIQP